MGNIKRLFLSCKIGLELILSERPLLGTACGIRDFRPYNPRRQKKIFLFAIFKIFIATIW